MFTTAWPVVIFGLLISFGVGAFYKSKEIHDRNNCKK